MWRRAQVQGGGKRSLEVGRKWDWGKVGRWRWSDRGWENDELCWLSLGAPLSFSSLPLLFLPQQHLVIAILLSFLMVAARCTSLLAVERLEAPNADAHSEFCKWHLPGKSTAASISSVSQHPNGADPPPFKISLCSLVVDSAPLLLLSIYYPCQAWRPRLTLFWMMRVRVGRVREGVDLRFFFPFRFQFQVEIYMRKCLDWSEAPYRASRDLYDGTSEPAEQSLVDSIYQNQVTQTFQTGGTYPSSLII